MWCKLGTRSPEVFPRTRYACTMEIGGEKSHASPSLFVSPQELVDAQDR